MGDSGCLSHCLSRQPSAGGWPPQHTHTHATVLIVRGMRVLEAGWGVISELVDLCVWHHTLCQIQLKSYAKCGTYPKMISLT